MVGHPGFSAIHVCLLMAKKKEADGLNKRGLAAAVAPGFLSRLVHLVLKSPAYLQPGCDS